MLPVNQPTTDSTFDFDGAGTPKFSGLLYIFPVLLWSAKTFSNHKFMAFLNINKLGVESSNKEPYLCVTLLPASAGRAPFRAYMWAFVFFASIFKYYSFETSMQKQETSCGGWNENLKRVLQPQIIFCLLTIVSAQRRGRSNIFLHIEEPVSKTAVGRSPFLAPPCPHNPWRSWLSRLPSQAVPSKKISVLTVALSTLEEAIMVLCVAFGCSTVKKKNTKKRERFLAHPVISFNRWRGSRCAMRLTNAKEFGTGGCWIDVESDNSCSPRRIARHRCEWVRLRKKEESERDREREREREREWENGLELYGRWEHRHSRSARTPSRMAVLTKHWCWFERALVKSKYSVNCPGRRFPDRRQ